MRCVPLGLMSYFRKEKELKEEELPIELRKKEDWECNFKHITRKGKREIEQCVLGVQSNCGVMTEFECSGEHNCILYKIYKNHTVEKDHSS